jgi:hypothetical protein
MENVGRPPSNPKCIIIQSSQECFIVDIPRVPATSDNHKPTHADVDHENVRISPVTTEQSTLMAVLQN